MVEGVEMNNVEWHIITIIFALICVIVNYYDNVNTNAILGWSAVIVSQINIIALKRIHGD